MSGFHSIRRKTIPRPAPMSSVDASVELLEPEIRSAKEAFSSPTINYIQDDNISGSDKQLLKQQTAFHMFLRTLQLDTLYNGVRGLFGHGLSEEEPKQAVIKSISITLVTIFAAHLFPMGAALGLVILNIKGFYLGSTFTGGPPSDDVKLSLLQFAAKAHEVMMLASMSFIVVGLVRHDLVMGTAVPFGALFGSLQFTSISYLVSKEFTGVLKARLKRPFVKLRLVTLLLVASVLAVTVGPSSAIAIRPRLDIWPAGGTDFYLNATIADMWPSRLGASSIPASCGNISISTSCVSRDWMSISQQIMSYFPAMTSMSATIPEALRLSGRYSVPVLSSGYTLGLYTKPMSTSTIPMYNLADAIAENGRLWTIAAHNVKPVARKRRNFMWRTQTTYRLKDVYQPSTRAQCVALEQKHLDHSISEKKIPFSSLSNSSWGSLQLDPEEYVQYSGFIRDISAKPHLQFFNLSSVLGDAVMGAIATLPNSWPGGKKLLSCTFKADWNQSSIQSGGQKIVEGLDRGGTVIPIHMTKEWLSFLNPTVQDGGKEVFQSLLEAAGSAPKFLGSHQYFESVIESILSSMTATALARTASDATIQGKLKGCVANQCTCGSWCRDMMPLETQEFGYGGNIYDMTDLDVSKLTKFTMHVDIGGYAYSIRGQSMVLSCAVLLAYCLMVLIHIFYMLINRTTSSSFNTVSEVVVLSMQSQPTDHLVNTSAGIYTTKVFSKLVKIVRTGEGGDHLELDFGDRDVVEDGDGIVEGEFYG